MIIKKQPFTTYNNGALISPENSLSNEPVVVVNDKYYFNVVRDTTMKINELGLNTIHRNHLKTAIDEKVSVSAFKEYITPLYQCKVKIESVSPLRAGLVFKRAYFDEQLRVLNCIVYSSCIYIITVNEINFTVKFDPSTLNGNITPETLIEITSEKLKFDDDQAMLFKQDFSLSSLGIGGLDDEFMVITRRAFSSRALTKRTIEQFGIKHVKGVLLYGPP